MLSTDKNIDELFRLILETKNYAELKARYLKVDTVDKLVRLLTAAAVWIVIFALVMVVIFFLSVMLATFLSHYVGGLTAGFGIVAAVYALLIALFYAKRRSWVERPLANFLGHLLLDEPKAKGKATPNGQP